MLNRPVEGMSDIGTHARTTWIRGLERPWRTLRSGKSKWQSIVAMEAADEGESEEVSRSLARLNTGLTAVLEEIRIGDMATSMVYNSQLFFLFLFVTSECQTVTFTKGRYVVQSSVCG